MINKYRIFIITLLISLSTNSFGQSGKSDFSLFKRKFQDLSCPCQFGKPNCKSKLNSAEIVNILGIEVGNDYDSIINQGIEDYYCSEYIIRHKNFTSIFYSHTSNETVDVSLATFNLDGKLISSKVLGTNYEYSNDYHSFTSNTVVKIESTNMHVTNTSTKLGVNDTVNDADSTVTKSTFSMKYGRIRKTKESTTTNALNKFYSKFKSTNYPLTIKQPNKESLYLQDDEVEYLLKEKTPNKWNAENYQAEYIFKAKTFISIIYSHTHKEKGYEVTDMLMSTFLNNGRLNDTKILGSEYEQNRGDDTQYSSFEIKIDSENVEVKNTTFKKSNKVKGSRGSKGYKSSKTTYTLDNGFINENGKSDFKSFCEKFELADISKNMKWDYDKPHYIQDIQLKTFLNIEPPLNNEIQYYKAEYMLKSENITILIYSQINGLSQKKYSDIFMSTFSREGKLIDTQLLGTYYAQNREKYTHHSTINIKVDSTIVNVSNETFKVDNEPYDCSDAIDYRGITTIYTLKNGIILSKPFDYLRHDVRE